MIHADYYGRRGIVIDKEFRKVTISNPGTFRIGIEEAIAGGISDARNGKIFNLFSLIDVGERSGSGLCDVFHTWQENGFKKPEVVESIEPDRITIVLEIARESVEYHHELIESTVGEQLVSYELNEPKGEPNRKLNEPKEEPLTQIEHLVLECIQEDGAISNQKIADQLELSVSTVKRCLRVLKEKGIIVRQGSTRGRWVIL
ncbi:MAG: winged helix-turn-helix transcriptional regulator [Lachnospiraceae bacterium]|nr:winged helix-turn-helix transcriptional regulator [Lachnospiraceae bacterium]